MTACHSEAWFAGPGDVPRMLPALLLSAVAGNHLSGTASRNRG